MFETSDFLHTFEQVNVKQIEFTDWPLVDHVVMSNFNVKLIKIDSDEMGLYGENVWFIFRLIHLMD